MPSVSEWFTHSLRVRYEETDRMGVVYHANYVTWFEIARTEWTRNYGFTYREIEESGLFLPVVDLTIQYKQPARYDDEIAIRTRVTEMSPLRLHFEYEIVMLHHVEATRDPQLLVTGTSQHVWVDRDWKPTRLSKAAPALYQRILHATRGG
jgi:acyl-CoA thioester hydrolase